jgi:hypothetical protein
MTEEMQPAGVQAEPTADQITLDTGQLTVRVRERTAPAFYVLDVELETLRSSYTSPSSVFLGVVGGAAITCIATVMSVADLGGARPYFVIGAIALGLVTLYLLLAYRNDLVRANRLIDAIRGRRIS